MKVVTINKITLVNFKGIKSLTVDFGQVTEIRGANATGKSTIADAFSWVLFGKDTAGNSDSKFGIKTNDRNGKVIPKIDHEVTAILDVSGETVELRRVLSEDWVTPRGKAEPELKGNSTAYFYNGVPLKESEYKAKINEMISEDLFRMVTSPLYFPRLDWQEQREMLLKIAGGITLEEIAKDRAEFSELIAQLSGKSLAEYKAEIAARKKKIKEALDLIPARIDEVTRATPAAPDYKKLEAEKTAAESSLKEIEAAMQSAAEASRHEYEAQRKIQEEVNGMKAKQQQIKFDALQKSKDEWNNRNASANEASAKLNSVQRESETTEQIRIREMDALNGNLKRIKSRLQSVTSEIEQKRAAWFTENGKEYNPYDSELCPKCGYDLHRQHNDEARAIFEQIKSDNLQRITNEGKQLSQEKENIEKDIEEIKKGIEDLKIISEKERANFAEQLAALQEEINANPKTPYSEPKYAEIPEYMTLEAKIIELSNSLQSRPATGNNSKLTAKKRELQIQLDGVKQQLGLKTVIEANEKRKSELLKEEKDLAQQKANLEKQEFTADALVKEQMNEVERRVNLKFNLVFFKMFSQQINGGEKQDCILISKSTGAKFMDTNSADKMNIGLDIINTLCEFNGVSAPIFIDNAEGINRILPVNSQLIKLIVTTDKEIVIKQ
ncbi:MAG: AAA family ATPase [Prevotellaceae bacterium]|jgi:chromosome segregation ATPase|nr:AAA family ATPase [Prevotellaceae bacterium]